MTHFVTLVIVPGDAQPGPGGDLSERLSQLLAPFDENSSVEPYAKPCYWCDGTGKARKDAHDGKWKEGDPCPGAPGGVYWTEGDVDGENCTDGFVQTTYNPQSKWDWWQVGGRWPNKLMARVDAQRIGADLSWTWREASPEQLAELKNYCAGARKRDIDWERMGQAVNANAVKAWEEAFDPQGEFANAPAEDQERLRLWTHGIRPGETREQYLQRQVRFSVGAILTPDGEWHEMGRHGWFGTQDEGIGEEAWRAETKRIIDEADDEAWFVIVDCHI